MVEVTFVRLGGLSAVKYPHNKENEFAGGTKGFHHPPRKKGIYAFTWPYIEPFLCMWDERHKQELETHGFRHFRFIGNLWSHLTPCANTDVLATEGSWFLTPVDDFRKSLLRSIQADKEQRLRMGTCNGQGKRLPDPNVKWVGDPYKNGLGGWTSRDHLEVFIDHTQLARIR